MALSRSKSRTSIQGLNFKVSINLLAVVLLEVK